LIRITSRVDLAMSVRPSVRMNAERSYGRTERRTD